jgi:hypothetical protein
MRPTTIVMGEKEGTIVKKEVIFLNCSVYRTFWI